MALQNKNGVYLKVIGVMSPNNIIIEKYENRNIRLNGPTEFEQVIHEGIYSPFLKDELNKLADSSISVKNNEITAGYKALKRDNRFMDWKDV